MGGYSGMGMYALAREAGQIPLSGQQYNPVAAATLAGLLQEQQQQRQLFPGAQQLQQQRVVGNQLELGRAQQQQQDDLTFNNLLNQSGGNMDAAIAAAPGKVSPRFLINVQQAHAQMQQAAAQLQGEQRAALQATNKRLQDFYNSFSGLSDAAQQSNYPVFRDTILKLDPGAAAVLPQQPISRDQLRAGLGLRLAVQDSYLTAKPGESVMRVPAGGGQPQTVFSAPAKQPVPGRDVPFPPAVEAQRVEEKRQERDPGAASDRQFRQGQQSYQYSSSALDRVGQPIEQLVQRMGRLKDTLAQANPQADALVAPELLTVMAGGMGSGLRMNEAEISRIVGGRNAWESLKSAIARYQSDPSKPFLITPAQRGQINALLDEVNGKLQAKQQILDDARQQLAGTNDPMQHRQILTRARNRLMSVDQGQGNNGAGVTHVWTPNGLKAVGGPQ